MTNKEHNLIEQFISSPAIKVKNLETFVEDDLYELISILVNPGEQSQLDKSNPIIQTIGERMKEKVINLLIQTHHQQFKLKSKLIAEITQLDRDDIEKIIGYLKTEMGIKVDQD